MTTLLVIAALISGVILGLNLSNREDRYQQGWQDGYDGRNQPKGE